MERMRALSRTAEEDAGLATAARKLPTCDPAGDPIAGPRVGRIAARAVGSLDLPAYGTSTIRSDDAGKRRFCGMQGIVP